MEVGTNVFLERTIFNDTLNTYPQKNKRKLGSGRAYFAHCYGDSTRLPLNALEPSL